MLTKNYFVWILGLSSAIYTLFLVMLPSAILLTSFFFIFNVHVWERWKESKGLMQSIHKYISRENQIYIYAYSKFALLFFTFYTGVWLPTVNVMLDEIKSWAAIFLNSFQIKSSVRFLIKQGLTEFIFKFASPCYNGCRIPFSNGDSSKYIVLKLGKNLT